MNAEKSLYCSVDWLSLTLKDVDADDGFPLLDALKIPDFNITKADTGMLGYKEMYICSETKARYLKNGQDQMGHHLILSGRSCSAVEIYSGYLYKKLPKLLELGAEVTRLDLALDIYNQKAFSRWKNGYSKNKIKGKFHQYHLYETKKNGKIEGGTLYFGSPKSQLSIRIYDKAAEQKKDLDWTRIEIQIRKKRAPAVINSIIQRGLRDTLVSLCSQYITLLKKPRQKNRGRDVIDPWWQKLTSDAENIRLTEPRPYRTLEETFQWLEHQAGPSLAKIWESGGHEAIMSLVKSGLDRI